MSYPSKTYSLSDDVIDEIARRVLEQKKRLGKGSPNQVLTELFWPKNGRNLSAETQQRIKRGLKKYVKKGATK